MLTHNALLALHESLRNQHVLTAYVDTSATDPALQRAWRLQLDHALDEVEAGLDGAARTARMEFVQCRRALESALASSDIGRSPGWVGFATADGAVTPLSLPIAAPTRVAWDRGAALGPFIRAQKHAGDVVVAVVDAKHATLYRYSAGLLQRVERVRSHHPTERADHLGAPSRSGFHTGTRGRTARDAAQRTLRYGRDRMLSEAASRAMKLLNADGWIVVAGTDAVASKLVTRLDALEPGRVARAADLDVHSSEPEIAAAAREHALALSAAFDCKRLADVAEAAGAHRLGVMGVENTAVALDQACVRTLFFTPDYLARHGDEAERQIRVALDQGAAVSEVEREAAAMLDERGGIAAALRFRPAALSAVSHATEARSGDGPLP